ncbi:hypothetical protein [Aquimarina sp. 2201CG14-23]|uniref:hypothetical protein n=1 Tax=Aquimarina mycalae TaxID=3040073 RepID=UPI0024781EC7|nr:hypothetical protein [Aquimarina sp. 2201CG14-23]MDH7448056.1 hypothetical protein [Aquimarina sp. 2201CG14-23]
MKKLFLRIGIQLIIFFVLLELGLMGTTSLGLIQIGKPQYNFQIIEHFWNDSDSTFGVWRKPYHEYMHITSCFNINYKANSIGARDIERELNSSRKRVIVIGDSFTEGWGVEIKDRFSNQLENISQLEFINMGVSRFGLTQEYLLYKNKAKKYDHDAILWALFPENDVIDDDLSYMTSIHKNQYKPFWKGEYPNYKLVYGPDAYKEGMQSMGSLGGWKGILKNFTYTYHFYRYIKLRYIGYTVFQRESHLGKSGHFRLSNEQWNRIKYNIEKLLIESKGKQVNIITIPSKYDIVKYKKEQLDVPLRDSLDVLSAQLGFSYYDLLKEFKKDDLLNQQELYFDCDDHWNVEGHKWAAKVIDSVFSFKK